MTSSRTTLAPDARSAGVARRLVVAALHSAGREAQADIAEVLVSELVTNAILHARTSCTLVMSIDENGVRISVTDDSAAAARRRDYGSDATTGRGLALVEALASSWGSRPSSGGKTVWFELREPVMAT